MVQIRSITLHKSRICLVCFTPQRLGGKRNKITKKEELIHAKDYTAPHILRGPASWMFTSPKSTSPVLNTASAVRLQCLQSYTVSKYCLQFI